MKSYTQMINKGIYISISSLMLMYGVLLIMIFNWFSSYHGGNIEMVTETSIYMKMLYIDKIIQVSIPIVMMVSIIFMVMTTTGVLRKYYIRAYGKVDFFKTTLIHNIVLAALSSGLMFGAYLISVVGTSLTGSNLVKLYSQEVAPSIGQGIIIYTALIALQLIIVYVIYSIKDRSANNLNKYQGRMVRVVSIIENIIRGLVIVGLLTLFFNSVNLFNPSTLSSESYLITDYIYFGRTDLGLVIIMMAGYVVVDYYIYYYKKVIN